MTVSELVAGCLETRSETGPAVRRKAVGELRAEDGVCTGPVAVAAGRSQIDATIAAVQGRFPARRGGGAGPAPGPRVRARSAARIDLIGAALV